jgi:hypothetical protein
MLRRADVAVESLPARLSVVSPWHVAITPAQKHAIKVFFSRNFSVSLSMLYYLLPFRTLPLLFLYLHHMFAPFSPIFSKSYSCTSHSLVLVALNLIYRPTHTFE